MPSPRDRLARAAAPRTFNVGLARRGDWREYTHVMKLDGDIELPPRYFREMVERFDADPTLGLAGGVLDEPAEGGGMRRIRIARTHVHGALKLTRAPASRRSAASRSAWAGTPSTGPTPACTASRTRSFDDLVSDPPPAARQRRRHGARARPPRRLRLHRALQPAWVALRSRQGRHAPPARPVRASRSSTATRAPRCARVERVPDADFRRFTRRELRGRMVHAVVPHFR